MSTGLDSFSNPEGITAMYPFVGFEVVLVIISVVLWIAWHVLQTREETKEYAEAIRLYEEIGLERAMHHNGSANIARPGGDPAVRTGAGGPGTTGKAEPGPQPRRGAHES